MFKHYSDEIEERMQIFYESLSEKDRRRYAAIETLKLPFGGQTYISDVLGCDTKTIQQGLSDLENKKEIKKKRIRDEGGGKKSLLEKRPNIEKKFLEILKKHTAGDPQNEKIIWTDLSCTEIAKKMGDAGERIGRKLVKKLLKKHGYKRRKIQKRLKTGTPKNRNEQFEKIHKLRKKYQKSPNPVISVDTKKKEPIGNLYRPGTVYSKEEIRTFDHDFKHLTKGTAVPHGIYDLKKNSAYINIGTSYETAEFACDSIKKWWNKQGQSILKRIRS